MALRSGSLNRTFIFERRTDARNEFNELVGEWVEIARIKGEMRALNAREFFAALQAQSERSYRLACRWSAALALVRTTDRVRIDLTTYDITSIGDPTGRRKEMELVIVEHDEPSP